MCDEKEPDRRRPSSIAPTMSLRAPSTYVSRSKVASLTCMDMSSSYCWQMNASRTRSITMRQSALMANVVSVSISQSLPGPFVACWHIGEGMERVKKIPPAAIATSSSHICPRSCLSPGPQAWSLMSAALLVVASLLPTCVIPNSAMAMMEDTAINASSASRDNVSFLTPSLESLRGFLVTADIESQGGPPLVGAASVQEDYNG